MSHEGVAAVDAERLIEAVARALAEAVGARARLAACRQVFVLVEAVAGALCGAAPAGAPESALGPPGAAAAAEALAEAAGRARAGLAERPPDGSRGVLARTLDGVPDPGRELMSLDLLLDRVSAALVELCGEAAEDPDFDGDACLEAVDSVGEVQYRLNRVLEAVVESRTGGVR